MACKLGLTAKNDQPGDSDGRKSAGRGCASGFFTVYLRETLFYATNGRIS